MKKKGLFTFAFTQLLIPFFCASFLCLNAQTAFETPPLSIANVESQGLQPREATPVDIDLDGDLDIVVASGYSEIRKVVLLENLGGNNFSDQQLLFTYPQAHTIKAADIDGDGDFDLAVLGGGKLSWYENSAGVFSLVAQITNLGASDNQDMEFTDLNADGNIDLVTTGYASGTHIIVNQGGGTFFPKNLLTTEFSYEVEIGDIDNDGDADILFGGSWIENLGSLNFAAAIALKPNQVFGKLADLDDDGDLDAFYTQNYESISWSENLGSGTFGPSQQIAPIGNYYDIDAVDIDGDGLLDVITCRNVSAPTPDIVYFKNLGSGSFDSETEFPTEQGGAKEINLVDTDGDSDLDILTSLTANGILGFHENQGSGFGAQQYINQPITGGINAVFADMDGDGDMDVIPGDDYLGWFENDGSGQFGEPHLISPANFYVKGVIALDADNDADQDIVFWSAAEIYLFTNDGTGNFSAPQQIYDWFSLTEVVSGDTDNDGDIDLIGSFTANASQDSLFILENLGAGIFSSPITLTKYRISSISTADINQDGLLDIVTMDVGLSDIHWVENLGSNTFSSKKLIDDFTGLIYHISSADLNGNGFPDIINCTYNGIYWQENTGGSFAPRVLLSDIVRPSFAIDADLDQDGDADILTGSRTGEKLWWLKNLGSGNFSSRKLISNDEVLLRTIDIADADGDNYPDMLVCGDNSINLYRNVLGPICSTVNPPANLSSTVNASTVQLSWDPVPGSTGCQLQGSRVSPPGPTSTMNFPGAELSSKTFPIGPFGGPSTWVWSVRCVCELSPTIDATPFAADDLFTIGSSRNSTTPVDFAIAPNPAVEFIGFSLRQPGNFSVEITDLTGRLMYRSTDPENTTLQLDLNEWQPAVYIYKIDADGKTEHGSFVKQ